MFLLIDEVDKDYTVLDTSDNVCEGLSDRVATKLAVYVGTSVCSVSDVIQRIKTQATMCDDKAAWVEGQGWSIEYMPFITDVVYKIHDICPSSETFVIPYGYSVIDKYVFDRYAEVQCTSLILPESVQIIADDAFMFCSLKSIELPSSVKYLGDYSFAMANLLQIKLNEGLRYIGLEAFRECVNLYELEIPSTITCIPNVILHNASNIHRLVLNEGLLMFNIANLWDLKCIKEFVVPNSVLCLISSLEEKRKKTEGISFYKTCLQTLTIPLHLFIQASTKGSFVIPTSLKTLIIQDDGSPIRKTPYEISCSWATNLEKVVLPEGMRVKLKPIHKNERITKQNEVQRVEVKRTATEYATDWGTFEYRFICSNSGNIFYAVYWHDTFLCCLQEKTDVHICIAFLWKRRINFQRLVDFENCLKNFQLFC